MSRDRDDESTQLLGGTKNPLNVGNDEGSTPPDPLPRARGEEAEVSLLMLEASDDDDHVDKIWHYFSLALKIFFTVGLAPSLWHDQKFEDMSKSTRARYRMTDLFSMSNIAIASHYWNVGVAMGFLSTPIIYYLVDVKDAESALVNQYSALTCM
jgi:hypothetical protein